MGPRDCRWVRSPPADPLGGQAAAGALPAGPQHQAIRSVRAQPARTRHDHERPHCPGHDRVSPSQRRSPCVVGSCGARGVVAICDPICAHRIHGWLVNAVFYSRRVGRSGEATWLGGRAARVGVCEQAAGGHGDPIDPGAAGRGKHGVGARRRENGFGARRREVDRRARSAKGAKRVDRAWRRGLGVRCRVRGCDLLG